MAIYKDLVQKIPISPYKKTKQKDYLKQGQIPIIDQGQQLIGGYTDDADMTVSCELPVIVFGDHTRVVKYIPFPFGAGADGIKVLQPKQGIHPKFLYYGTQYLVLRLENKGYARHYQHLEKKELDVPAMPEQKRIIARIEEMFSQLDSSVETLKKIKWQLEVYRQSILKEAFKSSNIKKSIREITSFVTSGSRGWAKFYSDMGARFIRITDLTGNKICLKNDNIPYVSLPDTAEGKRSRLMANDVLVSITADLGSIALVPETIDEAYINQHIAMIQFNNPSQGEYMAWYLKSDFGQKDLLKNKRGGGKLGLGLDDIRDPPVPIVSDDEARSTIELINSRMSVCDNLEQTVDTALQQDKAMWQGI